MGEGPAGELEHGLRGPQEQRGFQDGQVVDGRNFSWISPHGHEHGLAGRRSRAGALRHWQRHRGGRGVRPTCDRPQPRADAASGIDSMRASIATVRDGFTDTQHRILFQQELPGGWVVLHWQMTGIHTGDAFGFAASGNPCSLR
ncbi:ester cyclase [Streptomyces sp. NPDC050211]|uniref:ester cyclase n=1 Tax=Streptomyces sp. NPDC050211 TaxID=3154932 RepID=UPI00341F3EEC